MTRRWCDLTLDQFTPEPADHGLIVVEIEARRVLARRRRVKSRRRQRISTGARRADDVAGGTPKEDTMMNPTTDAAGL